MVVKATLADHFMLLVFLVSEKSINIDHAYLLRNKTIDQSREKKTGKRLSGGSSMEARAS